ncbi:hypothetical protein [Candidatus Nitrospira bockiana]
MPRPARCLPAWALLLVLIGTTSSLSAAAKVPAKLIVEDALTWPGQTVRLEARLLRDGILLQPGLGGERLEFFVGGKSAGSALTGGDGRAVLEFTPRMRGNLSITARLGESPRVEPAEGRATLFSWERRRPILLVEFAALVEEADRTPLPFPTLPGPAAVAVPRPIPQAAEELKRLTAYYFNAVYLARGSALLPAGSHAVRDWLAQHQFPPGVTVVLSSSKESLAEKIEDLRKEGWDNLKAGIGRTLDFAEVLVEQRMEVVIVPRPEGVRLPRKAQVAESWNDVRKKKL